MSDPHVIHKEMGYTRAEFELKLPRLFGDTPFSIEDNRVVGEPDGKRVELELSPDRYRTLSPIIRMPVMDVTIRLYGYSESERADFIRTFDLKYFKGGG